jgi:hypothetical protein
MATNTTKVKMPARLNAVSGVIGLPSVQSVWPKSCSHSIRSVSTRATDTPGMREAAMICGMRCRYCSIAASRPSGDERTCGAGPDGIMTQTASARRQICLACAKDSSFTIYLAFRPAGPTSGYVLMPVTLSRIGGKICRLQGIQL